ncbi:MAG: hypothetical protein ACOX9E_08435 [Lentisphaeria bacterium]|jgi:hypothetical protein
MLLDDFSCLVTGVIEVFFVASSDDSGGEFHRSLGLRLWRNPREAPTRNSTLKACHIADTKDGFHCKATGNGQLSTDDRLPTHNAKRPVIRRNTGRWKKRALPHD